MAFTDNTQSIQKVSIIHTATVRLANIKDESQSGKGSTSQKHEKRQALHFLRDARRWMSAKETHDLIDEDNGLLSVFRRREVAWEFHK